MTSKSPTTQIEPSAQKRQPQRSGGARPSGTSQTSAVGWKLSNIPAHFRPSSRSVALQPKLAVGGINDPLEHEADRVADQVMSMPSPARSAQIQVNRKCAACESKEHEKVRAKPAAAPMPNSVMRSRDQAHGTCATCGKKADPEQAKVRRRARTAPTADTDGNSLAPASVDRVLGSPGRPLASGERSFFEPRFGRDFGRVRLHHDAEAGASAREVGALAYAVGEHVVVDPGRYSAASDSGRRLLAHELAHVVQQGGADAAPESSGDGAKAATPQADLTPSVRRIQRFSHTDSCSDADLRGKIWPGDGIARQMVDKAIRVLSATPVNPAVTPLFTRFFMTATPNIPTMLSVYNSIKATFTANNYTYECNNDCEDCAYVRDRMRYILLNPNIHLCLNTLGAASPTCFGYTIVHELSHYSVHTADNAYCHSGCCTPTSCPTSLTATAALDNADSYGAFANDLFPLSV
jgi:hypothetical protein